MRLVAKRFESRRLKNAARVGLLPLLRPMRMSSAPPLPMVTAPVVTVSEPLRAEPAEV